MSTLGKIGEGQSSWALEPLTKIIVYWRGTDNELYSTVYESLIKESKVDVEKVMDAWKIGFEAGLIEKGFADITQSSFWGSEAEENTTKVEKVELFLKSYKIVLDKGNSDVWDVVIKIKFELDTEIRC